MEAIAADQVRAEVRTFWNLFCIKDKTRFDRLYSPTATVFAADARRSESARLMLVRRERELFGPTSLVKAQLGDVAVQLLTPHLAVAYYALHFSVTRMLPNGSRVHVEVPFTRVTQVFQRGENGGLTIMHEHMSSAEPTSPKTLPAEASSARDSR